MRSCAYVGCRGERFGSADIRRRCYSVIVSSVVRPNFWWSMTSDKGSWVVASFTILNDVELGLVQRREVGVVIIGLISITYIFQLSSVLSIITVFEGLNFHVIFSPLSPNSFKLEYQPGDFMVTWFPKFNLLRVVCRVFPIPF